MIRVFPRKTNWTPTDDLAFVGDPPLFRPSDSSIPVRVSCVFSWDRDEAERLKLSWARYYSDVQVGGPAFDDPGGEFAPGRFVCFGVTITSRGCPKRCGWCLAAKREGRIRELVIKDGWNVFDNNLLACSERHIRAVFEMLKRQQKPIVFSGGLDKRLLQPWHRELFDAIRIGELWFACDTESDFPHLETAAKILEGIPPRKRRCYTMAGWNGETIEQAEARMIAVYKLGFWPFCQLYRADGQPDYSLEWKALQRRWSRPAIFKSLMS